MATERKSPDAILASTNLSGVVADIQDDPDSPDANWMVASGNNVNTDVRTSFPTPTGNPTVGADLQEFKIWVRQFDEGQTGTPEARVELWENGLLVRAGSDNLVPDGGLLLSFTWNANEIGTPDGSLVECNVVGAKSGGSPGNRNTVDVGAVEWNVTYTAAVVVIPSTKALTTSLFIPVIAVSDNQVAIPTTASLATTAYTPIIAVSDNQTVIPNTLALTTTKYAPVIALVVIPSTASLSITAYAPTISVGGDVSVIPDTEALNASSFVPIIAVSDNITVIPSVASLATNTFIPVLDITVVPNIVALATSTYIPTVLLPKVAIPEVVALSITSYMPTVLLPKVVIPTILAHNLTTFIPIIAILENIKVTPNTVALIIMLFTPTILIITPIKFTLEERERALNLPWRLRAMTLQENHSQLSLKSR